MKIVLLLLFPLVAAHRSLPEGVTCGNQFNSSATALLIPNAKISWASYRILTCDAPIMWLKTAVAAPNQNLSFTALVPLLERFAAVRVSVLVIGPGLPTLGSGVTVPSAARADIKAGEGAVLFDSVANQSTCDHTDWMMKASSSVYNGRCHFHEPYGNTRSWVLLDRTLKSVKAGMHRFAVFTTGGHAAKVSFACCDWPEDFVTQFPIAPASCPACGTNASFGMWSDHFFETRTMANYSGFPPLQTCSVSSAPVVPTAAQCPKATPSSKPTKQDESCKLGCSNDECHSHNVFGKCIYDMYWITPKPKLGAANVTKLVLFKGDKVKFGSDGHYWPHNLVKMQSAQTLSSCSWAGSSQILTVGEVRAGTVVTFAQAGTFHYSCQMTGHCQIGQKLTVVVKDASEGMRCHGHEVKGVGSMTCTGSEFAAHVMGNAMYGATSNQCSEMCTSAAGLNWVTGGKKGTCLSAGWAQMKEDKEVQAGQQKVSVRIFDKVGAPMTCVAPNFNAHVIGKAAYGATATQCSEMCTTAAGLAWVSGGKNGTCISGGWSQMKENKEVQAGQQKVPVRIFEKAGGDSCHCHSYEQIKCDSAGDALYDEHVAEIQKYCQGVVKGTDKVCPYKCFQPFEVMHINYMECSTRPKHALWSQIDATNLCHKAAKAPFGTQCSTKNMTMNPTSTITTTMTTIKRTTTRTSSVAKQTVVTTIKRTTTRTSTVAKQTVVFGAVKFVANLPPTVSEASFVKDAKVKLGVEKGIASKLKIPATWVSATLAIVARRLAIYARRLATSNIKVDFTVTIPPNSNGPQNAETLKSSLTRANATAFSTALHSAIKAEDPAKYKDLQVTVSSVSHVATTTPAPKIIPVASTSRLQFGVRQLLSMMFFLCAMAF